MCSNKRRTVDIWFAQVLVCATSDVLQVSLDKGVFKYVLMRLWDKNSDRSKLLVWGDTRAAYHMHVFQDAKSKVGQRGRPQHTQHSTTQPLQYTIAATQKRKHGHAGIHTHMHTHKTSNMHLH